MTNKQSMIQIGAGSMGGALLKSWVESDLLDLERSALVDPRPSDEISQLAASKGLAVNPQTDHPYDLAVIGVKPQQFSDVLPQLNWPGMEGTLFVSIAAGVPVREIESLLKTNNPAPKVLRVMPTLPAKVRAGVSLLAENPKLSAADRQLGERLMAAAGAVHWCQDEDQLDRLMGVTGCAPAFVFRVAEALTEAAIAQGASPEAARMLAEETVIGSAKLLASDGRDAASLRAAVTSPGGTTAAGLAVLDERALVKAFVDAVEGAYIRARELAGPAS
ncbi:MAG: pyrroline-5-carboxylate reductase [Pseudomonadota bacterium]